ncbi:uncharacterized protein FFMR_15863 [Fusarium fujikuroi]|nr:uncharacterized protein FFMR_15863 [Fusarium fujikuroi]
MSLFSINYIC